MAQIISNQANLTYSTQGSSVKKTASSNIANTTLLDAYGLEVSKQSFQQSYMPGENITFAIRVTNTGYKALNNFVVVDAITEPEEGTSYMTYMPYTARVSIDGNFIAVNPTGLNPLTFNIPNELGFGESFTLTYVVTVLDTLPADVMEITNTATVTPSAVDGSVIVPKYVVSNNATIRRNTEANLVISKSVSKATIFDTDSYQYVLSISNMGLTDATNVVVTDTLPKGFTVTNIRLEDEDFVHDYDPSEYTIAENNLLTVPNDTGTAINVKAYGEEGAGEATLTISGNFVNPAE